MLFCTFTYKFIINIHCYAPPVWKGAVSGDFVRPSITYIANNWRTKRPDVSKFGMKVSHLWCDLHNSFEVKTSRSPGPLMLTHIFRIARPTNLKLSIWMDDDDPHQPQAPWPLRSKVKVARSRDLSEPSWPNAVFVSLQAGGAYRVGRSRQPHFLFLSS